MSLTDFMATFKTPDYIVDGIIQRGRLYALTSPTSHGKTAANETVSRLHASILMAGRHQEAA